MAIRIRRVRGKLVALCAAENKAKEGDLYLDDEVHHALTRKFEADFKSEGYIIAKMRKRWASATLRNTSEAQKIVNRMVARRRNRGNRKS